ncbi:MAG TPA: ABC transporter permease [Candidatus Hungatella pullicola]|nr:ABC transporter permease [Candidatus Hungatella pullicola]
MMLKLIRLEWKKHALWKYIRNAAITTAAFIGLLILIASDPSTGEMVLETGKSTIHSLTEMFMNMAYLVFTGVMFASFVVAEYENKLMHLMFSYPIKRKKIMLAKIFSVFLFNFIVLLLSKLLIYLILIITKGTEATGIYTDDLSFWSNTILSAFLSICSSCFALVVGMKMKSSKACVISAFVVMLVILGITQGNVISYLSVNGTIAYLMQIAGAFLALFLSIHNIETEDVN